LGDIVVVAITIAIDLGVAPSSPVSVVFIIATISCDRVFAVFGGRRVAATSVTATTGRRTTVGGVGGAQIVPECSKTTTTIDELVCVFVVN
jgi:hypothetical protein